jgi:hypothetical protein
MSSIRAHFFLLCGILLFAGSASAQNLLTNGSFEDPPFSAGTANYPLPSIPGWTSTADFEVWNQLQGPAADGNQYLEMDVSTCTTIRRRSRPVRPGTIWFRSPSPRATEWQTTASKYCGTAR